MVISASDVKDLREKTGAGMMDCKKALEETGGDMEKAIDVLRKKGLSAAAKKSDRITSEGLVGSYIHAGGKIGVLLEVNCETDFVAKTVDFQEMVKDLCMHIAAANPSYVKREEVPADVLDREKEIYKDQARQSGKPENILDKIIEGKVEKFYGDVCLLDQVFVKDPDGKLKIKDLITNKVSKIGENISVRRFARFQLGEGLQKRSCDFAAEVAEQLKK
ncbi:MAG TPA: translation elongation factor Ts [Nitrospirota bacterium]|nr:translation elongation factor Ts [Nitrospirota bacterium]